MTVIALPLLLSVHGGSGSRGSRKRSGAPASPSGLTAGDLGYCPHCGCEIDDWNEDSVDETSAEQRSCCALCHLAQHLERPQIEREAILIWLPEFTHGALNALVRKIHLTLAAHEKSPWLERTISSGPAELLAAESAYAALGERSAIALERVGTTSPRDLAEALLLISPGSYVRRDELLGGLRLLSLGRFFVNGRDIYPRLLSAAEGRNKTDAAALRAFRRSLNR